MIFVVALALLFHLLTLFMIPHEGFSSEVTFEVMFYSSLDVVLSIAIVILLRLTRPDFFISFRDGFQQHYLTTLEENKLLVAIIVLIAGYQAYVSIDLILDGFARHDLMREHERAGLLYMVLSGFFKTLTPFVLYFKASLVLRALMFVGLLSCIAITASRSELMYVINIYIMLMMFGGSIKRYLRLLLIVSVMIFLAVLSTKFLQNRPISDGLISIVEIAKKLFLYKAYGYFLADRVMNDYTSITGAGYPFLGYIYEFFTRFLGGADIPVDSEYVGFLHVLGTDPSSGRPYLANVKYPWWSWYVGIFGGVGLFIKALYSYLILAFLAGFRLYLSSVYMMFYVLFGVAAAHPFLTLFHVIAFFVVLFIDVALRFYSRKRGLA